MKCLAAFAVTPPPPPPPTPRPPAPPPPDRPPQFQRFGIGRSIDSHNRSRQLLVEQICALAGGPCIYLGRDMKTSHGGLAITGAEWEANMRHTIGSLEKFHVPQPEQQEFLELFTRYQERNCTPPPPPPPPTPPPPPPPPAPPPPKRPRGKWRVVMP